MSGERPPGIFKAQLPNLHPYGDQEELILKDRRRAYEVVEVVLLNTSVSNGVRQQDSLLQRFPGDHLYLRELSGATAVGVRVRKGGKFIPLHEGETITREFEDFTVRNLTWDDRVVFGGYPGKGAQPIVATFVVSYGQAVLPAEKRPGFKGDLPAWRGTATPAGVAILDGLLLNPNYPLGTTDPVLGKNGGTIIIRNLDFAASIFVYSGLPATFDSTAVGEPSPNTSFEIFPREALTLDLKGRTTGLCVACLAGTVPFNVLADGWGDLTDQSLLRLSLT